MGESNIGGGSDGAMRNKGFSSGNVSETESNGGVTINNNYSSNVIAIINNKEQDLMNTTSKTIASSTQGSKHNSSS